MDGAPRVVMFLMASATSRYSLNPTMPILAGSSLWSIMRTSPPSNQTALMSFLIPSTTAFMLTAGEGLERR